MNNITYMNMLITACVLLAVVVSLWIVLILNGVLRNPIKISVKYLNKSKIESERLILNLANGYTKKSDDILKKLRNNIKLVIRFTRQYTYENDDDRIKEITSKLCSIDISLSLIKKICFQSGSKEAIQILEPISNDFKKLYDIASLVKDEAILYEASYKDKYKK